MLYGERDLGAPLIRRREDAIGVFSSDSLKEAAFHLREIRPEDLFEDETQDEGWHLPQFRAWRELYIESAQRGDDILIQVC
jgi:hypothetical protein